jgi:5-hydroxyisourate hydrolase
MSAVTTHVLDTALGRPAAGVPVRLERLAEPPDPPQPPALPEVLAEASTDGDGRVASLGPDRVEAGTYRLAFDTAAYFAATGRTGFFPRIEVVFELADPAEHYHVPVLLSSFSYTTYRGS